MVTQVHITLNEKKKKLMLFRLMQELRFVIRKILGSHKSVILEKEKKKINENRIFK